ncbi:LapA family protein [Alteromonas sp. CYL-A6]|uniref:LapA family protein n=1 Tax=Alteromonas nitratireducens TaxID=3390813 RepID=UPI0034A7A86F
MKGIISVLVIVFLLALAFAVGSQNDAMVSVNYLIAQAEMRLSTLIGITLTLGVLIGVLIMLVSWLSLRVKVVTLRAKVRRLTKDS